MHTMAVSANRAPVPYRWPSSLENGNIHPMPGYFIDAVHICRETIFGHQFLVGVTASAKFGCINLKLGGARVLNIMHAVAICAHRHIWVVLLDQGAAVYALLILIKDFGVALSAGLRNQDTWFIYWLDIVCAVTIGADGRIQIAGSGSLGMHAVKGLVVIIAVAFLAGHV